MTTNRRWLLSERPSGIVSREHFDWVEEPVPELEDGEFLVRNRGSRVTRRSAPGWR